MTGPGMTEEAYAEKYAVPASIPHSDTLIRHKTKFEFNCDPAQLTTTKLNESWEPGPTQTYKAPSCDCSISVTISDPSITVNTISTTDGGASYWAQEEFDYEASLHRCKEHDHAADSYKVHNPELALSLGYNTDSPETIRFGLPDSGSAVTDPQVKKGHYDNKSTYRSSSTSLGAHYTKTEVSEVRVQYTTEGIAYKNAQPVVDAPDQTRYLNATGAQESSHLDSKGEALMDNVTAKGKSGTLFTDTTLKAGSFTQKNYSYDPGDGKSINGTGSTSVKPMPTRGEKPQQNASQYTTIGESEYEYTATDASGDKATAKRRLISRINGGPRVNVEFADGAVNAAGASIAGKAYTSTDKTTLIDGWTNQPLRVTVAGNSNPPGVTLKSGGAKQWGADDHYYVSGLTGADKVHGTQKKERDDYVFASYKTDSPSSGGTKIGGKFVGTVWGDDLSDAAYKTVKIDRTAPAKPGTSHVTFTQDAHGAIETFTENYKGLDALSGVVSTKDRVPSTLNSYKPRYMLVESGAPAPTESTAGWVEKSDVTNASLNTGRIGGLDLYAMVRDKAGNMSIGKVKSGIVTKSGVAPTVGMYYADTETPYGGEWLSTHASADTNRRKDVDIVAGATEGGSYDLSLRKSGAYDSHKTIKGNAAGTQKTHTKPGYNAESASASGESWDAILLDPADAAHLVELSPGSPGKTVKFDNTPPSLSGYATLQPVCGANNRPFPLVSEPTATDNLDKSSVIKYLFVKAGNPAPEYSAPGWDTYTNAYDEVASGTYDLYAIAIDHATNKSAASKVAGPVTINKEPKILDKGKNTTAPKNPVGNGDKAKGRGKTKPSWRNVAKNIIVNVQNRTVKVQNRKNGSGAPAVSVTPPLAKPDSSPNASPPDTGTSQGKAGFGDKSTSSQAEDGWSLFGLLGALAGILALLALLLLLLKRRRKEEESEE
jgi:hypothetical protein